jgi:hypothetical protein
VSPQRLDQLLEGVHWLPAVTPLAPLWRSDRATRAGRARPRFCPLPTDSRARTRPD